MIIDTMVFAYALLSKRRYREEATAVLEAAREIWVPDSLRAELANVAWQWARTEELTFTEGLELLRDANSLITHVVAGNQLWERALDLAIDHDHPVYDTLFVALGEQAGMPVVSYDRTLRRRFPDVVRTPQEILRR